MYVPIRKATYDYKMLLQKTLNSEADLTTAHFQIIRITFAILIKIFTENLIILLQRLSIKNVILCHVLYFDN